MNRRGLLGGAGAAWVVALGWRPAGAQQLVPLATEFIAMMSVKHGFDQVALTQVFAQLEVNRKVIDLLKPPEQGGRKVWWDEYRGRHLDWLNVGKGARFASKHAALLEQAAATYGVPGDIIAAIIGVETRYGTYTGKFSTLEALATLAFAYPPRADYFRRELEQLLLYAREQDLAVTELEGSYAGAFGYSQFMPTSARNWAVDMDGDGQADLFSIADAIGSVANFLREHGWEPGVAVSFPVEELAEADPQRLLDAGITPSFTATDFAAAGLPVRFAPATRFTGKLALVDLVNEDNVEYRAGTINYYVLTRYNRSNKYAMTVLDLARAIAARRS